MDEEEATELFSAAGANGAGPSSIDAPPSLQAAAAIEAAAAADFPARIAAAAAGLPLEAEGDARGAAALTGLRQLEAEEQAAVSEPPASVGFRTPAAATTLAAEAQQDALVTQALEAAQQQRDSSLAVDTNGSSMSLQRPEPPEISSSSSSSSSSRQPGNHEAESRAMAPDEASNGSQPTVQHAAQQPSDGRPRCSSPSSSGHLQQQNSRIDAAGNRREGDSNSSVHTMQLRQPWPTHPGVVADRVGACCVASQHQHQHQPQGRMWE
jgi:hypothetical protein